MNPESNISTTRRRHVAALLVLPIAGCATSASDSHKSSLPRHVPERLGLLPVEPYGEVGLYSSASGSGFPLFNGIGKMFKRGAEKARYKEFTARLNKHELFATQRLNNGVIMALGGEGIAVHAIEESAETATAIDDWKFTKMSKSVDTVMHLEIKEIAFTQKDINTYWPIIYVGLSVLSTRDNATIGESFYQVDIESEAVDPRSLPPLSLSRFSSAEELLTEPQRVVHSLDAEFSRMTKLIVKDIQTLRRGDQIKWEAI